MLVVFAAMQGLFQPKKMVVVQYGLVHKPLTVVSENLMMDAEAICTMNKQI